ncbi:tRNA(Ile)-lysidine synthase [Silvimonas terrae]|uniref:tRNA(Ile)-lysidine synthase n=1 Tax=Silvimonas terrae TaxID=300266 RepID=A0A840RD72_9NEIS|nr:tRNA lysidine(34) synthetase TilS [Silvimonas terrae]MBB5190310.1 tRNA(Ile)-lysidine synthase [Silvimonas terrae]
MTLPDTLSGDLMVARLAPFCPDASPPARLCVGLSGGLDSVVLLHLLATARSKLPFDLTALHVHHGLSPNADDWAAFARDYAASLNVPCSVERVVLTERRSHGIEAAARSARYAAFARTGVDVVLTAHHQGDQVETVLLNLLRGSGLPGLAAMPSARPLNQHTTLLRPLLDIPRDELLRYAQQHGLRWIEDESNQQTDFDRNFLRHKVIPVAAEAFPSLARSVTRSARHIAEAQSLLDELAQADLAHCVTEGAFLLGTSLSPLRLRHALRHWLAGQGLVLDTRAFDELWRTATQAASDSQPALIWRKQAVRRYRDRLYVTAADVRPGVATALVWREGTPDVVPAWRGQLVWQRVAQGGVAAAHLAGEISLRPWQGARTLRLRADGPAQQLKTLAQTHGIAPWVRSQTPLLYKGEQLLAWPGVGVQAEFQATEGEHGWLPFWQPDRPYQPL